MHFNHYYFLDSCNMTTKTLKRKKIYDYETDTKNTYIFDILYSPSMAINFIKLYHPFVKLHIDERSKLYNVDVMSINENDIDIIFKSYIEVVVENELWNNEKLYSSYSSEYKIGDELCVEYNPFSQKYIEEYNEKTFKGKIIFVDRDTQNMLFIKLSSDSNETIIKTLEQEGCHFFGMGKGYQEKIIKN